MDSIVFQCPQGALQLSDCPYFFADSCASGEEAGVVCLVPCEDGGMRLVGGSTDVEGNVEVCVDGVWGTICDPSWGDAEAKVVCTSLGYSQFGKNTILASHSFFHKWASLSSVIGSVPYGLSYFGASTGPVHWTSISCSGSEQDIFSCTHLSIETSNTCGHENDVGVKCNEVTICEMNGYLSCCVHNCNFPYNGTKCYCDPYCYQSNDCCPGIGLTCPTSIGKPRFVLTMNS